MYIAYIYINKYVPLYIHTCVYYYIHTNTHIYIYTYRERERVNGRQIRK